MKSGFMARIPPLEQRSLEVYFARGQFMNLSTNMVFVFNPKKSGLWHLLIPPLSSSRGKAGEEEGDISLSLSLSLYIYIYIYTYIGRERGREREIHRYVCVCIYIYIHTPVSIIPPMALQAQVGQLLEPGQEHRQLLTGWGR